MARITGDRAHWLGRNILPHEPALRAWLKNKPLAGLDIDVDDVIQETYAILASRNSVDDIVNPKNYAFQTAYSVILMRLRRQKIVPMHILTQIESRGITADIPTPEQTVVDRDELRHVAEALALLPLKVRQAFILRRVHGLSQREIAAQLGVSENTIEKRIGKGIRHLMEIFGRGGESQPRASSKPGLEELNAGRAGSKNKPKD